MDPELLSDEVETAGPFRLIHEGDGEFSLRCMVCGLLIDGDSAGRVLSRAIAYCKHGRTE